jgi:ribosomal protein S18 acetylase RimI-like enzyme
VEIVRIGPDCWEQFREVRLASLRETPEAFGSRFDDWADADEERWRARLGDVPLTLLAREVGRTVGVSSGALDGEHAVELISMWVAPDARGAGVAEALIDAVVAWAEEQSRSTYLMVRSDNARARAAYERAGFVDTGVPDGWPIDQPSERRMEWASPGRRRR